MKRTIAIITVLLMLAAVASAQETAQKERSSIAIGLGVPYGVLGVNVDIGVAPRLALSGGVGTTVLAGMGYNFGAKYFLASQESSFRPLVGAYYGTNALAEVQSTSQYDDPYYKGASGAKSAAWSSNTPDDFTSFSGLSLMLGAQWMWGASRTSGLDLGVVLIASTGLDAEQLGVEEPGRVKIALGYRRAF